MKDFRIVARLFNNRLRERREATGMTACAFAESIGVQPTTYCAYESLKENPIAKPRFGNPSDDAEKQWKPSALRIADRFGVDPAEIWPEAALKIQVSQTERRFDAADAAELMSGEPMTPFGLLASGEERAAVAQAVTQLEERDRNVLMLRFGLDGNREHTLDEIGERYGVCRERMRQVESRALHKLKQLVRHIGEQS